MIKKAAIFTACLLLNLSVTQTAKAEEIVIEVTGNGSGASNEVQVQSQSTTEIKQTNQANISNNVATNASTGQNSANLNNGDTTIKTGDASTTTSVNNENINTNYASDNCGCQTLQKVIVDGNGANSTNLVELSHSNNTFVGQSNTARITNNITIKANTGNNKSLFNNGDATIITGDIKANTKISNKNINNSYADGFNKNISAIVKVDGSGAESLNVVNLQNSNDVLVENINIADIVNNVEHDLNTGGNETLKNIGDVVILTGNIISNIDIANENINSSIIKLDCNCVTTSDPDDPSDPSDPSTPTNPTSNGTSYIQSSTGSNGSSNSSAGNILPKTGITIPFTYFATLFLIFTFLVGLYLRYHSSKAPPVVA